MVKTQYRYSPSLGRRIAVETLNHPAADAGRRGKPKPFKADFVKLSNYWIEQLERSSHVATYKLANRILRETFKQQQRGGGEVILSAYVTGLPRSTRRRATKEMVDLNLIRIEQDGNKAVRVRGLLFGSSNNRSKKGRNGQ